MKKYGKKEKKILPPFEAVDESDANHELKQKNEKNDNLGWEIQIFCPPS